MTKLEFSAACATAFGVSPKPIQQRVATRLGAALLAAVSLNGCLVTAPCPGGQGCDEQDTQGVDGGDAATPANSGGGSDTATVSLPTSSPPGSTFSDGSESGSGTGDTGTVIGPTEGDSSTPEPSSVDGSAGETGESSEVGTTNEDAGTSAPALTESTGAGTTEVSTQATDTSTAWPSETSGSSDTSVPEVTSSAESTDTQAPLQGWWSESFEEGWGEWVAEGSSWSRGNPVNGAAPAPHGDGVSLVGTGLSGPYTRQTGRLSSPRFVVPSAQEEPFLRYWYWYALEATDTIQLQVRVGDNSTWVDVQSLTDTISTLAGQGGQWKQGILPLTALAGETIKVSFALSASGATGSHAGFFLDDVTLDAGPMTICTCQGFDDSNSGDWSIEGGQWGIGVPSGAGAPAPVGDGNGVAGTNLSGSYASLAAAPSARLASPTVRVADDGSTTAKFHYWYSFASQGRGTIQVRVVGEPWQALPSLTFTGQQETWTYLEVPLASWAGQLVQVGFLVENGGGAESPIQRGFYVDEFNF